MRKNPPIGMTFEDTDVGIKEEMPIRKHYVSNNGSDFEIRAVTNSQDQSTVSVEFLPDGISLELTLDQLFDLCSLLGSIRASCKMNLPDSECNKTMYVNWQVDGSVLFTCKVGLAQYREECTVTMQNKMDRMSVFNVCLHALAKELQLTPSEVMMQLSTMNRVPAREEIQKDRARWTNQHQKDSTDMHH